VGNVEGHDVFLDKADVIVCDGFVGNVLLKYTEGLAAAMTHHLTTSLRGKVSPDVCQIVLQHFSVLSSLAERIGGPLFGVDGVVVVGHGRSRARSVVGAIDLACLMLEVGMIPSMKEELSRVQQLVNT
jgi:glycerol-3-phosphate acyltransferase PlsX